MPGDVSSVAGGGGDRDGTRRRESKLDTEVPTWGYGPSKAPLHHMTQYLAKEHILVNAVALGGFATPLIAELADPAAKSFDEVDWSALHARIPLGHLGRAEDVAGVAILLSSCAGGYMVGSTLCCDGGLLAAATPSIPGLDYVGGEV